MEGYGTPTVEPGQPVLVGQVVGESPNGIEPPIHCGVSGRVVAVEPRPSADGEDVLSVVVENDRRNLPAPLLPEMTVHEPPSHWISRMREAGLTGMGGAGFPTWKKYGAPSIDRVLINGCECEPYLTCDHRVMLQRTDRVVSGALALGRAAGVTPRQVIFCVEGNKPDAIHRLKKAAEHAGMKLKSLPDRYPQGESGS